MRTILRRGGSLTLVRDGNNIDTAVEFKWGGWVVRAATADESAALTREQNARTLREKAEAALAANLADIEQDANLRTQALALAGKTGTTFTAAQLSDHVRSLAQAVAVLAAHDAASKKQNNALIRLTLNLLDDISGT